MWRFVLRENILRFKALIGVADSGEQLDTLRQLLQEAQSELDQLEDASTPEIAKRDARLDSLAHRAVDQAMALRHAQFASLQIYDESREHLIILAQRNLRAAFLHYLAQMRPGDGSACGRCLADDTPVVIEDIDSDAGFEPHREAAREAGFKAVHSFPVRDGAGNLIAVLSVYYEAPQGLSDEDIHRMTALADLIGSNLEKHLKSES